MTDTIQSVGGTEILMKESHTFSGVTSDVSAALIGGGLTELTNKHGLVGSSLRWWCWQLVFVQTVTRTVLLGTFKHLRHLDSH